MKKVIKNLRNPRFQNKGYYLLLLPLSLLSLRAKYAVREFATKHWHKNPAFFHRLYWVCQS